MLADRAATSRVLNLFLQDQERLPWQQLHKYLPKLFVIKYIARSTLLSSSAKIAPIPVVIELLDKLPNGPTFENLIDFCPCDIDTS